MSNMTYSDIVALNLKPGDFIRVEFSNNFYEGTFIDLSPTGVVGYERTANSAPSISPIGTRGTLDFTNRQPSKYTKLFVRGVEVWSNKGTPTNSGSLKAVVWPGASKTKMEPYKAPVTPNFIQYLLREYGVKTPQEMIQNRKDMDGEYKYCRRCQCVVERYGLVLKHGARCDVAPMIGAKRVSF